MDDESKPSNEIDDQHDGTRTRPAAHASKSNAAQTKPKPLAQALAAIAVIAVVLAAAGWWLYAGARVPNDAAAKVDDFYISEQDVSDWIGQYRSAYSLSDDADFASALASQNLNVVTFRQSAVNQLALAQLIANRADELGIEVSEDDVQARIEQSKEALTFGDDGVWADTLSQYGMTEDDLRLQIRSSLLQQAVCEADVERREAADDEVLSFAQTYLSSTTQKHAYRIVFYGDDAADKANECLSQLMAARDEGEVGIAEFTEYAKRLSEEEGVEESGGSYAWSGSSLASEEAQALDDLDVGTFSSLVTVESTGAAEILFCDADYTFPASSEMMTLPEDIPDELRSVISDAASEALWSSDCETYLSSLLIRAKITYYPVPDNAAYNVDMSLAAA